mgnify:CR=1 FL=1
MRANNQLQRALLVLAFREHFSVELISHPPASALVGSAAEL